MQFKFKNMLLYVRNVVEPFMRAERDISKREIQKLEDFLTREIASMKAHLNQEIADLRAHIIQTTTELRYEVSQLSTIEVGFVLPWPTHQALLEAEKWLLCDGSWFDKSKYPRLYTVLGREYTPNYAGMFLRGYGSQSFRQYNGSTVGTTTTYHSSGGLNEVQGDATRKITGYFDGVDDNHGHAGTSANGTFSRVPYRAGHNNAGGIDWDNWGFIFDNSYVTPTANENRPVNIAVKFYIRALK